MWSINQKKKNFFLKRDILKTLCVKIQCGRPRWAAEFLGGFSHRQHASGIIYNPDSGASPTTGGGASATNPDGAHGNTKAQNNADGSARSKQSCCKYKG